MHGGKEEVMKYFPKPEDLTLDQLRNLYQLSRFSEWESFNELLYSSGEVILNQMIAESLRADSPLRRDIGALAYISELKEFMDGIEEHLELKVGK